MCYVTSCTDTQKADIDSYGLQHHIKQFSCGQVIGEWDSTGKVENEGESDGYRFKDSKTQTIVRVSGSVQITIK